MPMTPLSSLARPTRRQIQAGFSLIEILVAIVVISLGLLGLAGLQAASLRNNQVAYFRSIASQQAYDMMDRMRVNLAGVRAGNYNDLQGALGTIWSANPNLVATGGSRLSSRYSFPSPIESPEPRLSRSARKR